jgi:hypothetical protein
MRVLWTSDAGGPLGDGNNPRARIQSVEQAHAVPTGRVRRRGFISGEGAGDGMARAS